MCFLNYLPLRTTAFAFFTRPCLYIYKLNLSVFIQNTQECVLIRNLFDFDKEISIFFHQPGETTFLKKKTTYIKMASSVCDGHKFFIGIIGLPKLKNMRDIIPGMSNGRAR